MKVVIVSGQSNAVGGGGSEGGDLTPNTHVKVWNGSAWITAAPGTAPFYPTESGKQPRNNVAWNACKRLQEETGEDVYMILSGLGSTPISAWAYPTGAQWIALDASAKGAFASAPLSGRTTPDYFIWLHGGSDTGNTHYKADFLALRDAAIGEGWLSETTPTVCGEIYANNEAKAAVIDLLNDPMSFSWMNFASNAGIPIIPPLPHPTGPGCVEYGRNSLYPAMMDIPRRYPRMFMNWVPTLIALTTNPTVTYDGSQTYGGSYLLADGLVFAWFKLTLKTLSGGSGALHVSGLPYVPSLSAPALCGFTQSAVAVEVDGLNGMDYPTTILMKTNGENGIRLMRSTASGTFGLVPSKITGTFTLSGSISYFTDD